MSSNRSLLERTHANVPRGLAIAHPIAIDRAQGAQMTDVEGKSYLDFVGGIGVLNVGHNHPTVIAAVEAQLERLTHTSFQVAMYEGYVALAERLNALAPIAGPAKTLLVTTGAEAVENAIKIARAATGRPAVIALTASFHGRTLLTMSLTGKSYPYKQDFGPYSAEVYHAPFPYAYRGVSSADALEGLRTLFATQVSANRVAAIIFEPVAGEGGFIPIPTDYLQGLRALADEHGILLISDEIQSGFGRTGTYFAIEHSGVKPDLITSAKSLAAGFPLAAVTGRSDVMDAPSAGGLGGTYAGNPVAVAAALAVFEVIESEGLLARSIEIGRRIGQHFEALAQELPVIGDVRGLGGMMAVELVRDRTTKAPAADVVDRTIVLAREAGLLTLKAGLLGNVIRVLVPLVVSDAQLERGLEILSASLRRASAELAPAPAAAAAS
jgi:4-aminobutyrate aminotransferase/(S)-3-amino-2-methylpropionate transaminase